MRQPLHPAILLLVDAVRTRLRQTKLPESAVRGALLEALLESPPAEGRLTPWMAELIFETSRVTCRRLGVPMPDLPSMTGLETDMPRDLAGETVHALLDALDPELSGVLRQLEVRDARAAQVAVRLGLPPKRVAVIARHGREQVREVLIQLAGG